MTHQWIAGGTRPGRDAATAALPLPPALAPVIDAHRRRRGPYTMAGTLLRAVVPAADQKLVAAHDVEILAVAPELRGTVPATRETLTSLAAPAERTRYYSRQRTTRIAHGLVEFLREHSAGASIVVENVDHADPTDVELLAALMRRVDPDRLTVVVRGDTLPEELAGHAVRHEAASLPVAPLDAYGYVRDDCVSTDERALAAYQALSATERAALHDQRAAELERTGELSPRLGAVPYHRERGGDPAGAGVTAVEFALDHCSLLGFYHATLELAERARALVGWDQPERRSTVNSRMAVAFLMLERIDAAEALYDEARLNCTLPAVHMKNAYMTAMLYTRFYPPRRRDERLSRMWIHQAIAIASTYPDPAERAFQTVFNNNGLALVDVRAGKLADALALVTAGLDRLDDELDAEDHKLHRSVLRYNRGQVLVAMGRHDEAYADFTEVIGDDPNYAEYYFDRGNLLRRMGRDAEAAADYETAMRVSPPFVEVYYNRGDLRAGQGDLDAALADFGYVLELDPSFVDAYVNRAGLLAEAGEYAAAARDVAAGLALDPANAHLLCVRAQVAAADGDGAAARQAYEAALAADPELQTAWAGLAVLAFELDDIPAAISDLTRALELGDDPALRFNRATALTAAGRFAEALADLDRASELDPDDPDVAAEREACRLRLATA
jgi:tetratricopeptide (TPR) repeat protein